MPKAPDHPSALKVAGLFAGIGGIEQGLHAAGHDTQLLCELDPAAREVLRTQFPGVHLQSDVCELQTIGSASLLTAGFPCQDLSQAGRTAGIGGRQSGLVSHVFRLVESAERLEWLLLENVPFMLHLDRGDAMRFLTESLARRGFNWAYRVVDSRAFGLPQRRQRVLLLASRVHDPRRVLFADDHGEPVLRSNPKQWRGFYWTEGIRGLGWAVDAVPTLKGGSTIGIPSPPAIWIPADDLIATPDIRDAERLQGFPADWTKAATNIPRVRMGHRWKLVGNAVSVPVAQWVGHRLASPGTFDAERQSRRLPERAAWPNAAWGTGGEAYAADVSQWPVLEPRPALADFINYPLVPLSGRATSGFLERTMRGNLRFEEGFLEAVTRHALRAEGLSARETSRVLARAV